MKIAIVGAGISGCATYLLLKKHLPPPLGDEPHSITIYEAHDTATSQEDRDQDSSTPTVGGGLGVGANGLGVLKRLEEKLLCEVVASGYVVPTIVFKTKHATVLVRAQHQCNNGSDAQMHTVASSRHRLWSCLRSRIPESDIVVKQVTHVVADPMRRNTISFADGSPSVEADMVIGADGVKSPTRRALFPDSEHDDFSPHFEGLIGVGGFIPSANAQKHVEKGTMNFVFGGNGFFGYFFADSAAGAPQRASPFHVSEPGDRLAWWSTFAADKYRGPGMLDKQAVARQLRNRLRHWKDPVVQEVLASLHVDSIYPTWTVPLLPTWERDGVVLVGDAAHALPPTSGQGTSQALEDAEALTLLLCYYLGEAYRERLAHVQGQKQAIRMAAKRYENLRLPRVTKILRDAQSRQNTKRNKGFIAEKLMYLMLWIIGWFPSLVMKQMSTVVDYNVAHEVKKLVEKEKETAKEKED
ncbi:hypothetical protein CDD82_3998 [Ophiocordyceps australis]|uniref:FAD-binding domain-containing protein n=1 Tax=Ophiocordyceps australis TaxID=1399860 RepID=A0A2C5XLV0_9HYPO|nr:hypothetical protein CDD82_3998 [Ophiocordyceps australis]